MELPSQLTSMTDGVQTFTSNSFQIDDILWFLSALLTVWHVEEVQGPSQFKMNTYRVYFS